MKKGAVSAQLMVLERTFTHGVQAGWEFPTTGEARLVFKVPEGAWS